MTRRLTAFSSAFKSGLGAVFEYDFVLREGSEGRGLSLL